MLQHLKGYQRSIMLIKTGRLNKKKAQAHWWAVALGNSYSTIYRINHIHNHKCCLRLGKYRIIICLEINY